MIWRSHCHHNHLAYFTSFVGQETLRNNPEMVTPENLKFGDEGHFLLLPPFGAQSRNEKKLLDLFLAKNDQNTPHRLK
jgi:hypothetical protein